MLSVKGAADPRHEYDHRLIIADIDQLKLIIYMYNNTPS